MKLAEKGDLPFFQYQRAAYRFAQKTPKCALLMDMGLGKTRPTAALIADRIYSYSRDAPVLVVGPKLVIEDTWPAELQKWKYTRELRFEVLNGTEAQIHEKMTKRGVDVHLVCVDRMHILLKRRLMPKYSMVVLDEGQKLRNPDTRRWKAAELITAFADSIILLTGTPAPNGLHQLWAPMKLLDGGKRLGMTQRAFLNRWFTVDPQGKHTTVKNKAAKEQIQNRLKDICFTLLAEDYQTLPALVFNDIGIDMPDKLLKMYEKFEEEAVLSLPGVEEKFTAINAASLYGKLTQFSNGAIYDREKKWHPVHELKLEMLDRVIDEAFGENVLVVYQHRSDLQRILDRYGKRAVWLKDKATVGRWKAGEIEIGVGHPASIGIGTNLQSGGHIVAWFGLTWNLEDYLQTNKRIWRTGQTRPVILHRIYCKSTVDEIIMRSLHRKDHTQRELMIAMKQNIDAVLRRVA